MRIKLVTGSLGLAVLTLVVAALNPNYITHNLFAAPAKETPAAPGSGLRNKVSITVQGDRRVIRSNGIPDHEPGQFPRRGNPNRIAEQNYNFSVPLNPKIAEKPTRYGHQAFGVAINGVVFDPAAAEWWNDDPRSGWQYEPLSGAINLGTDQYNAHVQPTGAYHYHGIPTAWLNQLMGGKPKMTLLGWAADGFPIYGPWGYSDPKNPGSELKNLKASYRLKPGTRPSGPGGKYDGAFIEDYEYVAGAGDLDECNGRFGVTPEYPKGIYHYYLTEQYPFIPRLYRGTPDVSFQRHGPPGGPGGPGGRTNRGNRPPGGPPFGGPRDGQTSQNSDNNRGPNSQNFGDRGGPPPFGGDRDGNRPPQPGFDGSNGNFPPPPRFAEQDGDFRPAPPFGNNDGNRSGTDRANGSDSHPFSRERFGGPDGNRPPPPQADGGPGNGSRQSGPDGNRSLPPQFGGADGNRPAPPPGNQSFPRTDSNDSNKNRRPPFDDQ